MFDDFAVSWLRFDPGARIEPHTHDRTVIGSVIRGGLVTRMGDFKHQCGPDRIHVEPAGEVHSNQFSQDPTDVLLLTCDLESTRFAAISGVIQDCRGASANAAAGRVAHRLARELAADDPLGPVVVEGLGLELIAETVRGAHPLLKVEHAPAWLRKARDLMHDEFAAAPPIATIAERVGVHPMTLTRASAKFLGATPGAYMRSLRVRKALDLLRNSSEPISSVASQAGFADQSHLTRTIKAATGRTPASLRGL